MLSGTPTASALGTQPTATVFEFGCLYTHDVQRKQKRWQDGRLRFHSFNKRVMVHDLAGNFIGDTHWRESEDVQDGDELKLDRGVLIQVGEATGHREQDLTDIIDRKKSTQNNPSGAVKNATSLAPVHANLRAGKDNLSQLKPKPLSAVLGTPRGAYGRALLPSQSPFQNRQKLNELDDGPPPTKRQKSNITTNRGTTREVVVDKAVSRTPQITPSGITPRVAESRQQPNSETINISSDDDAPQRSVRTKDTSVTTLRTAGTVQQRTMDHQPSKGSSTRLNENVERLKPTGRLVSAKTKRNKLMCRPILSDSRPEITRAKPENFSAVKIQEAPKSGSKGPVKTTALRGKKTDLDPEPRGGTEAPKLADSSTRQITPAIVKPATVQELVRPRDDTISERDQAHSIVRATDPPDQGPPYHQPTQTKRSKASSTLPHRGSPETNPNMDTEQGVLTNDHSGPWSREAFDLFGWRIGDSKGVEQS